MPSLWLLSGCNAEWKPGDGYGDGTVNQPPTISLSSPTAGTALTTNQDLTISGVVQDDSDPEDLSISLSSSIDGDLSPPSLNDGNFTVTVRLSEGNHTLTLGVSDTEYTEESSVSVTVNANQPPSAPAVSISPTDPGTSDDLVATLDADAVDPDGDPITYVWSWQIDGVDAGIDGDTVSAGLTGDDETWTVSVYAEDGDLSSESATNSVLVNDGPELDIVIDPADPDVTDVVICDYTASDPTGGPVDITAAWTIDGAAAGDATKPLTGGFSKDQILSCEVNAIGDSGSTTLSASVQVVNAPPVAEDVTLNPTSATEETTLSCLSTVSDPDGDAVTTSVTWFVGGVGVTEANTINGDWFAKGDTIWCEATGDDGEDSGEAGRSASISVGNTAPTAPTVAMSDGLLDPGDPVECLIDVASTDVDLDTLTYQFRWKADGVTQSETSELFTDTAGVAGRELTCEARAGDGSANSPWSNTASANVLTAFGGNYLASDAALTLSGTVTSGSFTKIDVPGDVDGDGYDDLLVGAYTASSSDGAVYLFSSATLDGAASLEDSDADWSWVGDEAQLGGGSGMSGIPDVDGDGRVEILVTGFTYDDPTVGSNTGAAYLLLSGDSATWTPGAEISTDATARLIGGDTTDYCGISADGGDIDGDGSPDLFIGCYGDSSEANNAGAVAIFTDPASLSGRLDQQDADYLLTGDSTNDYLGWQGSHISGDVDGDGYPDLFLSAYNMDGSTNNTGAVLLVSGDDLANGRADSAAFARLEGSANGDRFGYSGATMGDVNGDGFTDLLIGADKDDDGAADGGVVTFWLGGAALSGTVPASSADMSWVGTGSSDYAGRFMAGGDLDGDGVGDALIGIPYSDAGATNSGSVAMLAGADYPWTGTLSADARAWIDGDSSNDLLGFGLALGDVSGDGLGDVLVGTLYGDDGASNGGTVHVFYGP